MALCIRNALRGKGRVTWHDCTQEWLDDHVRVKPEEGSSLDKAKPDQSQDIDGIYFGPGLARKILKVPNHCDADFYCKPGGGFEVWLCCNAFLSIFAPPVSEYFNGAKPDSSWPDNDWTPEEE